jgi:hypothetical protein
MPGPLAPPVRRRPKRKITALSYSCTTWKNCVCFLYQIKIRTLKHQNSENGRVRIKRMMEPNVAAYSTQPMLLDFSAKGTYII